MRFLTFLVEYANIIPHTYGAWMTPSDTVLVDMMDHMDAITRYPEKFGIDLRKFSPPHFEDLTYDYMFNRGWVRVVFSWGEGDNTLTEIALEGHNKTIRSVWRKIAPNVLKNNADVYMTDADTGEISEFHLPEQRIELIRWMNNEA